MKLTVKAVARLILVGRASLPLLGCWRARAADDAAQLGPQELVTKVAQDTLRDLDAHRSEYKQEPEAGARAGRQEHAAALRHGVRGAARARQALAHGDARAAQALRRSVLSVAAAELRRGAARVHARPPEDPAVPGQGRRQGRDRAQRSPARQRQRVPVNYSLRKTPDGWKAYDVQIEGVSYVKSFRTDFGSEIQQKGLEAGDPAPGAAGRERHRAEADGAGRIRKPASERSVKETGASRARLESLGDGRFRVSGVLDASTARRSAGAERVALRAVQGARHRPRRRRRERQRRAGAADRVAARWRARATRRFASPTCRRRSKRWRGSAKSKI